jgi:hypothetical protein
MSVSDKLVDNLIDEIVAIEVADAGALLDAFDRGRRTVTPLQYRKAARRAIALVRKYGHCPRVARAVRESAALMEVADGLRIEQALACRKPLSFGQFLRLLRRAAG